MRSYGLLRIFTHLERSGERYGQSMIRGTNECFIFLIYNIMWTYSEDYLKKHGNLKYCWELHRKKMTKLWLPYVDYNAFYCRIYKRGRNLYTAMHTPANLKKVWLWRKLWLTIRTKWLYIKYKFTSLFKKDEKHFRVRRSKG